MIEFIFCISTGRAGSNYLARLFSFVTNSSVHHEPDPVMNGVLMANFLKARTEELSLKMPEKISSIKGLKSNCRLYVETNHTFIKGFGWMIDRYLDQEKIGVVVLKREMPSVVNSLIRIKCNAFNDNGQTWLMHITKKEKLVPLPSGVALLFLTYYWYRLKFRFYNWKGKSKWRPFKSEVDEPSVPKKANYKLLEWYYNETYAMAEKFKSQFPGIKFYETNLHELNNLDEVKRMFDFFEIDDFGAFELEKVLGVQTNLKKKQSDISTN